MSLPLPAATPTLEPTVTPTPPESPRPILEATALTKHYRLPGETVEAVRA
jgi:hypothetical protein